MAPTATRARVSSPAAPAPPTDRRGAEDRAVVLAAQAGDSAAFGELFARWGDRVHDLALRIVRDHDRAADVTQDTFEVAWRRLSSLEEPLAFGGWLLRIARNRALDHLARVGRTIPIGDAAASGDRGPESAATDAAPASVEAAEVAALVWTASAALAPRDLSLLDLHLRHGLGAGEIAAELGVAPGAAHQMLHRLRVRLREAVRAAVLWDRGTPACTLLRAELRAEGIATFAGPAAAIIGDHADRCDACADRRRTRVSPEALFAAAPLVVMPATLRLRLASTDAGAGGPDGPGPVADTPSSAEGAPEAPGPAAPSDGRGGTAHLAPARGAGRRGRRIAAVASGAAVVVAGMVALLALPGPDGDTAAAIAAAPSSPAAVDPAGEARDGAARRGAAPSTAPSTEAGAVLPGAQDGAPTAGVSPSAVEAPPSSAAPGDGAPDPSAPAGDHAAPDAADAGSLGGSDEGDWPDEPGQTPVPPPAPPGAPAMEPPPAEPSAPGAPLIVSFSAIRTPRPGCATPSAAIVLTWRTSGGDVAVDGPGAPGGRLATSGTAVACSPGPATYVVVVTGPGGVAEQAVAVA